jgi:hypothetical protein
MRSKRSIAALLSTLVLAVALLPSTASHAQVRAAATPVAEFYLALGDGLTAGYQGDDPETIPWSHG